MDDRKFEQNNPTYLFISHPLGCLPKALSVVFLLHV